MSTELGHGGKVREKEKMGEKLEKSLFFQPKNEKNLYKKIISGRTFTNELFLKRPTAIL